MLIGLHESAESTQMSIGAFQRKQKQFIYMKTKFTLFALICWISLLHVHGQTPNAVVCADVFLTSQAEVNAFNCTELTGMLSISGSDITDLSPLQNLTKVGQLNINGTTNLT